MKSKVGLALICIGVLLLMLTGVDGIGIVMMILEELLSTSLNAHFFSSFLFRVGIMVVAGVILLIGGNCMFKRIHKENSDVKWRKSV